MGDVPEHPASPLVWQALLDAGMPQTALMRLPRLTRLGLFAPTGPNAAAVAAQITDPERLRRARVHPLSVLVALRTYASGHSVTGTSQWEPVAVISDALDAAFYAAFGAVEPAGKRTLLALDVSGSMGASIALACVRRGGGRREECRPLSAPKLRGSAPRTPRRVVSEPETTHHRRLRSARRRPTPTRRDLRRWTTFAGPCQRTTAAVESTVEAFQRGAARPQQLRHRQAPRAAGGGRPRGRRQRQQHHHPPSQPRNRELAALLAALRIAEREGVGMDPMGRDMIAIG